MPGSFNQTTKLQPSFGVARARRTATGQTTQAATRTTVGSAKKIFFDNNEIKAVHFLPKGQAEDLANLPAHKRAPYKIARGSKAAATPPTESNESHSNAALVFNAANLKEFNPAAPNGSSDLTEKQSLPPGHAHITYQGRVGAMPDPAVRKNTFYKTSAGQQVTMQDMTAYIEKGCMTNQGNFSDVAKYTHSRQYL